MQERFNKNATPECDTLQKSLAAPTVQTMSWVAMARRQERAARRDREKLRLVLEFFSAERDEDERENFLKQLKFLD